MEARGLRSCFEDQKYNTANWRYNWTARRFDKSSPNCQIDTQGFERQPVIFPSVLAFLCSKERINWQVELYEVTGEDEETELNLISKISTTVQGLGIPNPTRQVLRFSEEFVPLDNTHQARVNSGDLIPPPIGTRGHKYWTEERGVLEKRVIVEATPLGLEDKTEFGKSWEFRPHGRLLDMAIYLNS